MSLSSSPCLSSGNPSWRIFQKTIEGFDCKVNGLALGAALQHRSDGFLHNLADYPARFCGHVVACFVQPTKPGNILFNIVDSESRVPVLQAAMQTKNCENRNSLNNIILTLWSAFPCLKIRWSSEHSFISVFESLRWFRQQNNPDPLYSSALLDALHRALHAWAQNGISRFGPTTLTTLLKSFLFELTFLKTWRFNPISKRTY